MTLESLLNRTLIKNYDRETYFKDVQLVGDSLLVPNVYRADTIQRCFLPKFKELMPELTIKAVSQAAARAKDAGPRQPLPSRAFKKGYRPAVQGDMLGERE